MRWKVQCSVFFGSNTKNIVLHGSPDEYQMLTFAGNIYRVIHIKELMFSNFIQCIQ